jgi:hypothetical protein
MRRLLGSVQQQVWNLGQRLLAGAECTDRAQQALLVVCTSEVVSALRIRRDSGIILIGR